MSKKLLFILCAALVFLALAMVVWYTMAKEVYQATCRQEFDGCSVYYNNEPVARFYFEVNESSHVQPFYARLADLDADKASLELIGVNYYMGYNHYSLSKVGDSFVYRGVLPACIYSNMHWRVTVTLTEGNISYIANYDFFIRRDIDVPT